MLANPDVDEATHASVVATEAPPGSVFEGGIAEAVVEDPRAEAVWELVRLTPEATADGFVVATSLGRWVFELMPASEGLDRVLSVWKDGAGTYYRLAVYDGDWPRLESSTDGAEWATVPFPDGAARMWGAGAVGEGLLGVFPTPDFSGFRMWLLRGGRWTLVQQDVSGSPELGGTRQRLPDGRWLVATTSFGPLAGLAEQVQADCPGVAGARPGPFGWEVVLGDLCREDAEAEALFLVGEGADAIVVLTGRDGQVAWRSEPGATVEVRFGLLLTIALGAGTAERPVDVFPLLTGTASINLYATSDGVVFEELATGLFEGEAVPSGQAPTIVATPSGLLAFVPDVWSDPDTGSASRRVVVWETLDGRTWLETSAMLSGDARGAFYDTEAVSFGDQVLLRIGESVFLGGSGGEWQRVSDTSAAFGRTDVGWLRARPLSDGSVGVGVSADAVNWEFFDTGDVPIPEGCSRPEVWSFVAGEVWLSSTRQGQPPAPVACTWKGTFQADVTVPGPAGGTVEVDYPEWWYRSFRSLTPDLPSPIEVLSVGTYPLRPGGEQCAQVPENALRDLGPRDVLISLQVAGNREGGTPWPDEWSADALPPTGGFMGNVCAERPDLDIRWKLLTYQETGIYVLAAFGDEVADTTLAETWAILDSFGIGDGSG